MLVMQEGLLTPDVSISPSCISFKWTLVCFSV